MGVDRDPLCQGGSQDKMCFETSTMFLWQLPSQITCKACLQKTINSSMLISRGRVSLLQTGCFSDDLLKKPHKLDKVKKTRVTHMKNMFLKDVSRKSLLTLARSGHALHKVIISITDISRNSFVDLFCKNRMAAGTSKSKCTAAQTKRIWFSKMIKKKTPKTSCKFLSGKKKKCQLNSSN